MVLVKYLFPALAVASVASAVDCSKDKITIESAGDGSSLSSCTKINGDVVISDSISGKLSLDGVREIKGSLTSDGASNITDLSAPELETIGKEFSLKGLSDLNNLKFDSLKKVGSIKFDSLAHLNKFSFTKGVSKAKSVTITNTFLTTLEGIELDSVENLYIANNIYLKEVDVNQMKKITGDVDFSSNHKQLKISFPNLKEAQNMTFRNVSSVSLPSLESVAGGLGFYSNYMESFLGPNLTDVGSALVFNDNSALTNISLPVLKEVDGTFQIANNTQLKQVKGIPKLEKIGGALDFSGNLTQVDLPALKDIRGAFNMQSSGKLDCSKMDEFDGDVTKGKFTCYGDVEDPGKEGSKPSDSDDKDDNGAAIGGASLTYVVGFAGLVGAFLQFL